MTSTHTDPSRPGPVEAPQAVIQLRCIDVNGHWRAFVTWALGRLGAPGGPPGLSFLLELAVYPAIFAM